MKKAGLIIITLLLCNFSYSQLQVGIAVNAGGESGISNSTGIGTGYGPHIRLKYNINEKVGILGGFTYFLGKKADSFILNSRTIVTNPYINFTEFIIDINFDYFEKDNLTLYLLAGGNYTGFNYKIESLYGLGFHIGTGLRIDNSFVEIKYDSEAVKNNSDIPVREQQLAVVFGLYF